MRPVNTFFEMFAVANSAKPSLNGRRSLYVSRDIKKGEMFTLDNVKSVRPTFGLHPKFLNTIIGKKANQELKKGLRMSMEYID